MSDFSEDKLIMKNNSLFSAVTFLCLLSLFSFLVSVLIDRDFYRRSTRSSEWMDLRPVDMHQDPKEMKRIITENLLSFALLFL